MDPHPQRALLGDRAGEAIAVNLSYMGKGKSRDFVVARRNKVGRQYVR